MHMICDLHESSWHNLGLFVVKLSHHKIPGQCFRKIISLEDIDSMRRDRFDDNFVANIRRFLSFLKSQFFEPDIVRIGSDAVHPYLHINSAVDINSQICIDHYPIANQCISLVIHD